MKITLLNAILIASSTALMAQPIFTSNDVPVFGSSATFRSLYSSAPGAPLTFSSGENQTWQLNPTNDVDADTITLDYLNPANISGAETVPGCNLVIRNTYASSSEFSYDFIGVTPSQFAFLAYSSDFEPEIQINEEAEVFLQLPLEYGSEYVISSSNSFTYFLGFEGVDSVRTVYSNEEQNEVLGWGTLNIEGNSYNALLLVKTYTYLDSVFHLINGNWEFQNTSEPYSDISYVFVDPAFGGFIAIIGSFDTGKGSVETYMNYLIQSTIINSTPLTSANSKGIKVYPNPSNGTTSLDGLNVGDLIQIFDGTGKLKYSQKATATTQNIGTSEFANGLYSVNILGNKSVNSIKLVVAH
ncbi:MAG: T9SS type A sorting domain-containing protein [Bacteroidia bacterium]